MYKISGAIGVVSLKRNFNDLTKKVTIYSDNHSDMEYCKESFSDGNNIKNLFIKEKYKSQLLLEEVERNDKSDLKELWSSSEHTIALRDLYLKNKDIIEPIDIRQYLYIFSWELMDSKTEDILMKKYIENFVKFFDMKPVIPNLKEKIKNIKFKSTGIANYFNKLKYKFNNIISLFDNNISIKEHVEKHDSKYLEMIDDIASKIMDLYTIICIFNSTKKSILHAGLFHTSNILDILVNEFDFVEYYRDGSVSINDIKNEKSCIITSDE